MRSIRYWATDHAAGMNRVYDAVEWLMVKLLPLFRRIGLERVEPALSVVEKGVKGLMFDCQMCGQCVLSSTGMSCPMNCPKTLRNGPCGGVRSNGNCEVKPEMRCVWVEAARGARLMDSMDKLKVVQVPVEFNLKGRSSWLREAQQAEQAKHNGGSDSVLS